MLAISCDKCHRRYTATDEELQTYFQQAEGKRYVLMLCPHCGKGNKIAIERIQQALRFAAPESGAEESPATPAA